MPDLAPAPDISALVEAATRLDVGKMAEVVRIAITTYGVAWSWERLISPAWHILDPGPETVAAERLFRRAVSQILAAVRRPHVQVPVRTLMACADGEDHALPLEALATALAELGAASCVLGEGLPAQAVVAAADRLRPAVVVIWAQTADTADPRQIRALLAACSGLKVITAGPGWNHAVVPAEATISPNVVAALRLTLTSLAPHHRRPDRPVSREFLGRLSAGPAEADR